MAQQKITFNEVSTNTAIVTSQLDSASANGTGAILVPSGTTTQRPAATTSGYIRFNTTLGSLESANGTAWANVGSGSVSSGGGGVSWQPIQNTSFIAVAGNGYGVNTATGNVIVTLPASPTFGQILQFIDYGQNFGANNLTLYPNGNKINGNTANVILNTSGQAAAIVYFDNNKGWMGYSAGMSISGPYAISYLIVAGGGGGGGSNVNGGGAGGAGGLLTGNITVNIGTSYAITVGGGGAAPNGSGSQGSSSSGFGATAVGGGGGGTYQSAGLSGGSGGGAGRDGNSSGGGAATSGQGYNGGNSPGTANYSAGGGGGAGGTGDNGGTPDNVTRTGTISQGGVGIQSSISGSPTYYAGGGGGAYEGGTNRAPGGSGGGGNGGGNGAGAAVAGSTNTGGGGGGGQSTNLAGAGGSGIVIISYSGPQRATGGVTTSISGSTIHTFNSSGTFTA